MKLSDLGAFILGHGGEGVSDAQGNPVPYRAGVGVAFMCPCGCRELMGIFFKNPIDGGQPVDDNDRNLWQRQGDTIENLTLTPSILRRSDCGWHGFITNGQIRTV